MKKIFFIYDAHRKNFNNVEEFVNNNDKLYYLSMALDPMEDFEPNIEADNYSVLIWADVGIKEPANIDFKTYQERLTFDDLYYEYYDKRRDEIPKLELSPSDWEEIQETWKRVLEKKTQYVMFLLDESGEFDKVQIVGKDELSQEDLTYIEREHEKYLAWKKAEKLYNYDHEIIDDIWHSPADSVYDADIEKYLGREVGFMKHKQYTKSEMLAELQERLQRKEPVYSIVHWLSIRATYGIEGINESFVELLHQLQLVDIGWQEMISEEQLQEIADRLLLGQDVTL